MIRGTIYLLKPEEIISSTEFNGGMDLGQRGQALVTDLTKVTKEEEVLDIIKGFLEEYGYDDEATYETDLVYKEIDGYKYVDLKDEQYSSDYNYFKNLTEEQVVIKTRGKYSESIEVILEPQEVLVTNYLEFLAEYHLDLFNEENSDFYYNLYPFDFKLVKTKDRYNLYDLATAKYDVIFIDWQENKEHLISTISTLEDIKDMVIGITNNYINFFKDHPDINKEEFIERMEKLMRYLEE